MERLSVLIVEDSVSQREFVANMCLDAGVGEVALAENGRVALTMIDAREQDYDILICDLEMPDLDGIELIHLLASRKRNSAIIIVSGRELSLISAVELMANTQGLWVLDGVQKPLSMERLHSLLRLYTQRRDKLDFKPRTAQSSPLAIEELRMALTQRRFVLHYQPKIDMQSGQLAGVEALVRLTCNQYQIVFPNDFIPLCEAHGLIDDLSYEVIRLAIEQQKRWQQAGLDTAISVNLSAVSFANEAFSGRVMQQVGELGDAAKQLIFEVTETAIIQDIGKALSILTRLRLSGCGLSIDDYGTGYSSIKQLSQIPFTELKIDRSLIEGVSRKAHLQVIFESTLSMCNKLGLKVVAEGIEKKSDWKYLAAQGCHIGQGYYYSPPMPEEDLLRWWQAGMPALS
ncbi:EAL domain-containing response regulator [Bowmanella denitrificans]|uniref:EAL domain-containing response regulator n=1 Tax=Bowmanella denitrificans TaxID=366582 RepID=UPI000C9A1345|nr:EAL domain-containing response regulator [Bowmanella denitrificans]